MRALPLALAVLATLTLGACASFEEAVGRPDPLDWTYFDGEAEDVVEAVRETFLVSGVRVESIREEAGGAVITLGSRSGSVDFTQLLVQRSEEEGFASRAQIYPVGAPLPRWLEIEISGRI